MVGRYTIYWNKIAFLLACVAGVRKGRGRELGRGTTREGGGRRGTPARKPMFLPSRLLIKEMTLTWQPVSLLWFTDVAVMTSCENEVGS